MVWAVLMDLVGRLLSGNKTMPEAAGVLDRFVAMIGLRLEQAKTRGH